MAKTLSEVEQKKLEMDNLSSQSQIRLAQEDKLVKSLKTRISEQEKQLQVQQMEKERLQQRAEKKAKEVQSLQSILEQFGTDNKQNTSDLTRSMLTQPQSNN